MRRLRNSCRVAAAFICLHAVGAQAADVPGLDEVSLLSPRPISRSNPLDAPSRNYTGVPVAGWMLYPSVLAGVVFDDNVYQTANNKVSATGVRVKPALVGVYSNGIHKVTLYGAADARFYPSQSEGDVVDGRLGGVYTYEMMRDLVFRVQGEASRQTDIFNEARVGLTNVTPQRYNQYLGSASVQKSFGRLFTAFGATVLRKSYADSTDPFGVLPDQTITTLSGRVGYWVTPLFYGFVEPSVNWRNFDQAAGFDSHGTRVVGGVGTDRISLFRGEIYAGYQQQAYEVGSIGTVSGGVFGGRISWYPTRALTFSAQVDESIGESTVTTFVNPIGSATRTTSTQLRADYAIAKSWSARGRLGYDHVTYVNGPRRDDRWIAGATLNYDVFRNFGVALNYQYVSVNSNLSYASYDKNMVTLGATYKY